MRNVLVIGLAGLAAQACIIRTADHTESDTTYVEGLVAAVSFDVAAGDLSVRVADVEKAEIHRTMKWSGDRPDAIVAMDGDVLIIDVDCEGMFHFCTVDHEVVLPIGAEVWGETGAGDVGLFGLGKFVDVGTGSGDVEIDGGAEAIVETGSGNVTLRNLTGLITIDSGSGDVVGSGLTSLGAVVSGGAGNVTLEFTGKSVDLVDVSTGAGDVSLTVPPGSYAVEVDTGAGDVSISGVTTNDSSASLLRLTTGAGNVDIRGN
jgi:hypothetical protein